MLMEHVAQFLASPMYESYLDSLSNQKRLELEAKKFFEIQRNLD